MTEEIIKILGTIGFIVCVAGIFLLVYLVETKLR